MFAAACIGVLVATVIAVYQQALVAKLPLSVMLGKVPEGRLYFACVGSALLPIGLFWLAGTHFEHIHWVVPTLAVGCMAMGICFIYLATLSYLADTYDQYASSALAAQSFCEWLSHLFYPPFSWRPLTPNPTPHTQPGRTLLGGLCPPLTTTIFEHLTCTGALSLLGAVVSSLARRPSGNILTARRALS